MVCYDLDLKSRFCSCRPTFAILNPSYRSPSMVVTIAINGPATDLGPLETSTPIPSLISFSFTGWRGCVGENDRLFRLTEFLFHFSQPSHEAILLNRGNRDIPAVVPPELPGSGQCNVISVFFMQNRILLSRKRNSSGVRLTSSENRWCPRPVLDTRFTMSAATTS